MKLRFYLRGLGIGIVFSAMICSFGKSNAQGAMSDEDVIKRAKELGMVEGTVLSQQGEIDADYTAQINEADEVVPEVFDEDPEETLESVLEETESLSTETEEKIQEENVTAGQEDITEDNKDEEQEDVNKKEVDEGINKEDTVTKESEESPGKAGKDIEVANTNDVTGQDAGKTVTITVSGGSGSYTVALNCEAAGLVSDAKEFDTYMCANGYANRISVGTFEVPLGSDYETIAKILTKSR